MQSNLFENTIEKEYSFFHNSSLNNDEIDKILKFINGYVITCTPFFKPTMKNGTPYNIEITSIGQYGWRSDNKGYYYSCNHPNGQEWIYIPNWLYDVCQKYLDLNNLKYDAKYFDSCLINKYTQNSKLGMHIDNTERDLTFPIMSFSIGATAQFDIEFGNNKKSYNLTNGNIVIMDGKSRLCKHGIKKIHGSERFNLTFRKAI